jgi:hypothetical protein
MAWGATTRNTTTPKGKLTMSTTSSSISIHIQDETKFRVVNHNDFVTVKVGAESPSGEIATLFINSRADIDRLLSALREADKHLYRWELATLPTEEVVNV